PRRAPASVCVASSFHSSGTPPYLHSFPTRRSSDLPTAEGSGPTRSTALAPPMHALSPSNFWVSRSKRLRTARSPRARRSLALDRDRKSTRLNSSHVKISYAVFCLKKKKETTTAARH